MTTIVNVKVKNIRPTYNNLEQWMADSNNVYIGRKGIVFINGKRYPIENSLWHNPYKINKNTTRTEVLEKYKTYITEKITRENLQFELEKLKGKQLGCWCKPLCCHGDILLEIINNMV